MPTETLESPSPVALVKRVALPAAVELKSQKLAALERSALVGLVRTTSHQQTAVEALRDIKALLSAIEKARVKEKDEPLEQCRQIDKEAKIFSEELKVEELRINTALGNYQQEQLEITRRAEAQRQEELRRIERERIETEAKAQREREEQERLRQVELKRIADEQAAREAAAAKLASEAKNKSQREAAEVARKAAEEQAKVAAAEAARIEADRKAADEVAATERIRQQELSAQAVEAIGGPVTTIKAAGQTVKEEFDYEVKDVWLLAKMHPGMVKIEDSRSEIMAAIKAGVRDIKGLRIFPIVKNQVRGAKAIDI